MTTPQPAALPELPRTTYSLFYEQPGDLEDEGYQYVLDEPGYTADQMRAYAIAALQSQPAAPGVTGAVQTLIEALKADPEYAWAWHCNIAMAAFDEGLSHYAANKAAARFLSWLAQIDMTTHPDFPKAPEQSAAAGVSDAALPPDALAMCMQRAVEGFSEFLVGKCEGEPPRLSMAFVISLFEAILKETDKSKQIVAVAPDAVIDEIIGHAEQVVGMSHSGWDNVNPRELVRAILALRPQAVPMTKEQRQQAFNKSWATSSDFFAGIEAAEAHHGITAPAGGEGKA